MDVWEEVWIYGFEMKVEFRVWFRRRDLSTPFQKDMGTHVLPSIVVHLRHHAN